mmetsp:Transcript_16060/g.55910  ORF Transcript_16060/g.55910 Transcript_16060/m.55910 type:complete len:998 (-) Transcript_16060:151-3144(-)
MERKVFGPSSRAAPGGRTTSPPNKASSAGSSTSSKGRSRSPSVGSEDAGRSASGRYGGSGRSGSGKAGEGDKEKKKTDIDGSRSNKGDARKTKAAEPKVSSEGTTFWALPKLKEVSAEEQGELLIRKLRECTTTHNFREAEGQLSEKEGKRQTLVELMEAASDRKCPLWTDEAAMVSMVDMIGTNLFRTLTKRERTPTDMLDAEDDDPAFDPAWPHLELAYELLVRVVSSKEVELAFLTRFITQSFVLKLLELFDSDDPREREILKLLINRIYAKFQPMRSNLRRAIQNTLLLATTENVVQNGLPELLEMLGQYIKGFQMPLKEEHQEVLTKVLLPLQKVEWLGAFHSQLLDCIKKFTEKEPGLAHEVVASLLRVWPFRMASKQVLFLSEIDDMLGIMPVADLQRLQPMLARRLASCLSNVNSDVSEKALNMWKSEKFLKMIFANCRDQLPIIISELYNNATQHWHPSVHTRTLEVLKMLMERDAELFDASSAKHRKSCEEQERQEALRGQRWAQLKAMHDNKKNTRQPDRLPTRKSDSSHATAVAVAACTPGAGSSMELQRARTDPDLKSPASSAKRISRVTSAKLPVVKGLALERDRYGLAVSWARQAEAQITVELQALIVDGRGRIVDAVHAHNPTVAGNALVHRADDQLSLQNMHKNRSGTTWVTLSKLPESAAALAFVLCTRGGRLPDLDVCELHMVEEFRDQEIAHFVLESPSGSAAVVAILRRGADRSWTLIRANECSKAGRHFMDILEPTLGKVIREAIPTLPKRQKAMVSISGMAQGSVACLPLPTASKLLFVGLSWDLSPSASGDDLGLSTALVYLDRQGQSLGTVAPNNAVTLGGQHGGKGLLGEGILVDFGAAPQEAAQIFVVGFLAASSAGGMDLIQKPHCCVVDPLGSELLRYRAVLTHESEQGSEQGSERGLIAGRFFRYEESSIGNDSSRWGFQALGILCIGESWEESLPELQEVFRKPVDVFQHLPPEISEVGTPRVVSL